MNFLKHFPAETIYGLIAIFGGIARYLNNYLHGGLFNWKFFMASTVVSGFSGYMFALVGLSLSLPSPVLFAMAGTGGFFGDQTMKLVLEYVSKKSI